MALTTRVAAAQDALKTLLAARGGLSDVTVSVGLPDRIQGEHIVISGTIVEWEQEPEMSGLPSTAAREETFLLPVLIFVTKTAKAYTEVRDRALVLAGEVEQQLRDDHRLQTNVDFAEVFPISIEEGSDGSQRACSVTMNVSCRVRLV